MFHLIAIMSIPLPFVLTAVAGVIVAALVIMVAMRPSNFVVERSTTIATSPLVIHALVDDFREWQKWSPWENMDPDMHRAYEGPQAGVGAKYAWVGNKNVGEGRMTIMESEPGELIRIKLEFLKPFKTTNTTLFTFGGHDDHTHVTWRMSGKHNFMGKAFSLTMNMDKMIGKSFEEGLAKMKQAAEA